MNQNTFQKPCILREPVFLQYRAVWTQDYSLIPGVEKTSGQDILIFNLT
jgi:hypothetical protein